MDTTDAPSRAQVLIADLERRARVTANPLYVWNAILRSFMEGYELTDYMLEYIKSISIQLSPLIEDAWSSEPKIKPEDALAEVLAALLITGPQGKPNAFIRLRRDSELESEYFLATFPRLQGSPRPPPKHLNDVRNLKRRIAAGRKLAGWPTRTKLPPKL